MGDRYDLELIIKSHVPAIFINSREEQQVINLFQALSPQFRKPLYKWAVTEGLTRLDESYGAQRHAQQPEAVLGQIKSTPQAGIYVLMDFHHYLEDPVNLRLIKEICQNHHNTAHTLVFLSHDIDIPEEIQHLSAQFALSLPASDEIRKIILQVATRWSEQNQNKKVKTDKQALEKLITNLSGLTRRDTERLAYNAIFGDGMITQSDIPEVMKAKHELLNVGGVLTYEYELAHLSDVGGLENLKQWLAYRKHIFHDQQSSLDPPRGILLLGVQGCGKSLAAKATAEVLGVPLLRLDFGRLLNKYHGESEKNLRQSLTTCEVMAPCVLWMDEVEKGINVQANDGGTSSRMLGTLLTWMSEKNKGVFMVATANDIEQMPPELIRKGRLDEIFFVDLPDKKSREAIFKVHMKQRQLSSENINFNLLAEASEGFSGAEIEQAIVSSLYVAHANNEAVSEAVILNEIKETAPLSVTMSEKINYLRSWAEGRAVSAS